MDSSLDFKLVCKIFGVFPNDWTIAREVQRGEAPLISRSAEIDILRALWSAKSERISICQK